MRAFIEERAKLVRLLADKADPFTKVRLVMLSWPKNMTSSSGWDRSLHFNAKYRLAFPR